MDQWISFSYLDVHCVETNINLLKFYCNEESLHS